MFLQTGTQQYNFIPHNIKETIFKHLYVNYSSTSTTFHSTMHGKIAKFLDFKSERKKD